MEVAPAAATNPGIPPASLSSFLRVNPTIKGVVLADHGGPFINPYYESRQDTVDSIQAGSLAAAAVIVAETLHSLASGPATPSLKACAAAHLPPPAITLTYLTIGCFCSMYLTLSSPLYRLLHVTHCSLRFGTYTMLCDGGHSNKELISSCNS